MKTINNFKNKQKVYFLDKRSGTLNIGQITDEICSKHFKFDKIPLNARAIIPIRWENGEVGVVFYKDLLVSLKGIIGKKKR